MNYLDSIAQAKKYVAGAEGAVSYVTEKGIFRRELNSTDKMLYKIYCKKNIVYVEDQKGKKIYPKKEEKPKVSRKLPNASDEKLHRNT